MSSLWRPKAFAALALAAQVVVVAATAFAGFPRLAMSSLALLVATVGILSLLSARTEALQLKHTRAQIRQLAGSIQVLNKSLERVTKAMDKHQSEVTRLRTEVRGVRTAQQLIAQTSGATHESLQQITRMFFADRPTQFEEGRPHPE